LSKIIYKFRFISTTYHKFTIRGPNHSLYVTFVKSMIHLVRIKRLQQLIIACGLNEYHDDQKFNVKLGFIHI